MNHFRTSDNQLYLRTRAGIHRCLPDGSILPRIRMSKKSRRKLKLSLREESILQPLCSDPSSNATSALPQSESLATAQ